MLGLRSLRTGLFGCRSFYGKSRIGGRDIVGHGCNGTLCYKDDAHYPFPAVRFRENTSDIQALREKEKGIWKQLTLEEKKALYRASFCQTFAEFQHPTGMWKFCVGWALIVVSGAFWLMMFYHNYVAEPLPLSLSKKWQQDQLRRILDLHMNPVDGISSQWDYKKNRWKFQN